MNYDHISSEEIIQDIRDTEAIRDEAQRELDKYTIRLQAFIARRNAYIHKLALILDHRRKVNL